MTTTTKKEPKLLLLSSTATLRPTEFGGPLGTLCVVTFLPLLVLLLTYWANVGQLALPSGWNGLDFWLFATLNVLDGVTLVSVIYGILGLIGWYAFQIVLERWLPFDVVEGAPVRSYFYSPNSTKSNNTDNKKETSKKNEQPSFQLSYRMNGHLAFWVTLMMIQIGWPSMYFDTTTESNGSAADITKTTTYSMIQFGPIPLHDILFPNLISLAIASNILSILLSIYFYVSSFMLDRNGKPKILANATGVFIYDFFMGRELNPRSFFGGTLDWKEFCELRPGLILWMLIDIACLQQQYNRLGYVTGSMMLINAFQGWYVWDALYQEKAIVTTMDITTDGFGFMLVFGDLTWVPFTYSVQAMYLVTHDPHLSYPTLIAIFSLHCLGYYIFRSANSQKDLFRKDPTNPKVASLNFLQTKRGTKLLTSGWWGMARKINYTGDWLIGLSWCLLCGTDSIIPYFYSIYFFVLLVTRSQRDDEMCFEKYGDDWNTYKQLVPYRFVPGIW